MSSSQDDNPIISTSLQILDALADVGKALPFVAPAFILLKIIVDLEMRAEEVDMKCSDLLERIGFMVSHLPILQKLDVVKEGKEDGSGSKLDATKKVVQRMTEVMKDAASLIVAYRKQSKVARKLSLSNREKFSQMAERVSTCTSDLLLSLQIYQTGQLEGLTKGKLEILTRSVPMDDDDRAARTLVDGYGGSMDAILGDREVVKEFVEERKWTMDDDVMDELNANISETISQTHDRLEQVLMANLQAGLQSLSSSLSLSITQPKEEEQKFTCVQCDSPFTRTSNGPKSCSYHLAPYDSWSKSYACCNTPHPCSSNPHRSQHHCDYPYGTFFPFARGITGYTDTTDEWASTSDVNLESDDEKSVFVGELVRWVSRGARVNEKRVLVVVGRVWWNQDYYFNSFTAKELLEIEKSVRVSKRTLIFRTAPPEPAPPPSSVSSPVPTTRRTSTKDDQGDYAQAEWILSISGKITGIRLTSKVSTSPHPFTKILPLSLTTCSPSGDVIVVSQGGLRSYAPASPHVIPPMVRVGPTLKEEPSRAMRTFKTRASTPNFRVILRPVGDPPLEANPNRASMASDFFEGTVAVFNNHPAGSLNPITIAALSAQYRYIGEKVYRPVESCTMVETSHILPLTIDPRQSVPFKFQVSIPRTEEDKKFDVRWWNRAFCARNRPLRIKIVFEEIEGDECSAVLDYVFKPFPLDKPKERDVGFFFIDNVVSFDRRCIRVSTPYSSSSGEVIQIDGTALDEKRLTKVVYQAIKTGKTEIDLEIGQVKNDGDWEWHAYALVDMSCRRVYGFKVLVYEGEKVKEGEKKAGCLGYVLCPLYGDAASSESSGGAEGGKKTRPISYATEHAKLPPLPSYNPTNEETYEQDDTVDDLRPPVPPKPSLLVPLSAGGLLPGGVSPGGNGLGGVPPELVVRLSSIDDNLTRIANALETLVGFMAAQGGLKTNGMAQ